MDQKSIISKELIFNNVVVSNREDALRFIASKLVEKEYVKESYVDAVIERERVYPTGLPTETYGVAIPHTDIVHVNEPGIGIAFLQEPVPFVMMGTDDVEITVKAIFMLAVKEPKAQLHLLEKLMDIFQDQQVLKDMLKLNEAEISNMLNTKLNK